MQTLSDRARAQTLTTRPPPRHYAVLLPSGVRVEAHDKTNPLAILPAVGESLCETRDYGTHEVAVATERSPKAWLYRFEVDFAPNWAGAAYDYEPLHEVDWCHACEAMHRHLSCGDAPDAPETIAESLGLRMGAR